MTYKKMNSQAIDGTKELNLVVDDFDTAVSMLECTGMMSCSYQESYRMMYELDGCEVCFDRWPGISDYVEIE